MSLVDLEDLTTSGEVPTLDQVCGWVIELADIDCLDPDVDMEDQGVDSLDLIELAAALEDAYGVRFDETLLEHAIEDRTLRQVYDRVVSELGQLLAANP